jgi:uncharacterized protein (DUF362 family)
MAGRLDSPTVRRVPVAIETAGNKLEALDRALERSGFDESLDAALARAGKDPASALVAIKPNLMAARKAEDRPASYTDPQLVEHLVARLRATGIGDVAVVESRIGPRPVSEIATMVGYMGDGYRLVDLSDEMEPLDYGGVLGRAAAGRTWRDADVRISFAKNKAQWRMFYSGSLANLLGCLPEPDKLEHYSGPGHEPSECCRTILDALPVAFGLVDAWDSGAWKKTVHTGAVLASPSLLALDWVMGEKMELDPALNPVVREALYRYGRIPVDRRGDQTAWQGWRSPSVAGVALSGVLADHPWLLRRREGGWTIQ